MKRKIDRRRPQAAKWVQLLGCVFGLVLMLTEPLSAQNRPKTKDLLGDWYLDFKFAETTKRGTTEYTVFSLEKSTYIDDEDLKVYPPLRSVDKWKAVFEMHSKNDHAARVTSASHWKGLESITFDLNSPTNDR